MKKVLLATTALVFTAGFAAAEGHGASITISGEAVAGLKYVEDADEETTQFVELDFGVAGKTTTDGGLEVGASFDLDIDTGSSIEDGNLDSKDGALITDEEFYVSAGGITVTIGEPGAADDNVVGTLSDVGFDGIGIDDTAETFFDNNSQNILVKGEFGAITVAASADMSENGDEASEDYGVAAGYDAGTFSVGVSFTNDEVGPLGNSDVETFAIGGSLTAGGADIDLFFHNASSDDFDANPAIDADSISGYGASVAYPVGALTIVGTIGATDLDEDEVDFGVGIEYDLGGGVTLAGGIGQVDSPILDDDSNTVADMGIKVKF
ncbi:porin [Roseobacter sp. CCS2]|uniref:porin n=1 Tax=Roseobacter sp. CCS2 TaxID=391593 RepID=UPI0000F3F121|nr:porin [Roseobacter sp. CCS2]EBA11243.1 outer membrane porin, putative [Roseobacter sp. CCS2]